jgi:hypothetical protein
MSEEQSGVRTLRRVLNFLGGFFAGFLLIPAGAALAVVLLVFGLAALPQADRGPVRPFVLTTVGADVSRAGGVEMELRLQGDELQLGCRGTCDDLRLQNERGDLDSVRVLDVHGKCIICNKASDGHRSGSRQWSVSGAPQLAMRQEDVRD